jgi:uncharacterized RDD family membrane protein YckC
MGQDEPVNAPSVVSGEAVLLDLDRAGAGSRMVAGAIDLLIQGVLLIAAVAIDSVIASGDDAITAALLVIEMVAVFGGYPIAFEWLSRGRTPGKWALGLRVVRDDGGPIGFRQALTRGLSSMLLEKPGLIFPLGTVLALGFIAGTSSSKRVGDLLAGTFVLRERAGGSLGSPDFLVPYELQPWASALDLTRVDDGLAFALRQFVQRAGELSPAARHALELQYEARLVAVIAPAPPYRLPPAILFGTVLAERRRRAGQHP